MMELSARPDLTVVLPGLLDKGEYDAYQSLAGAIADETDTRTHVLDMYGLPGIELDEDRPNTYHCDFRPGDYLRSIHEAIAERTSRPANIVGFSYGAQMALMYARAAQEFPLNPVSRVVSIMPPNHWHWEEYDAARDMRWLARQYHQFGRIDMDTTTRELRSPRVADPLHFRDGEDDTIIVDITRRTVSGHAMPFDGIMQNQPVPVVVTELDGSGLLEGIEAPTCMIAGENDQLTPGINDRVWNMYLAMTQNGRRFDRHDYELLTGVAHDYREDPGQVEAVNRSVVGWLTAA